MQSSCFVHLFRLPKNMVAHHSFSIWLVLLAADLMGGKKTIHWTQKQNKVINFVFKPSSQIFGLSNATLLHDFSAATATEIVTFLVECFQPTSYLKFCTTWRKAWKFHCSCSSSVWSLMIKSTQFSADPVENSVLRASITTSAGQTLT